MSNNKGKPFVLGEDNPEKPEREMTDMIGCPAFVVPFPAEVKVFNMKRVEDGTLTGSVDLLMLGVGEMVVRSMRKTTATS